VKLAEIRKEVQCPICLGENIFLNFLRVFDITWYDASLMLVYISEVFFISLHYLTLHITKSDCFINTIMYIFLSLVNGYLRTIVDKTALYWRQLVPSIFSQLDASR